MIIELDHTLVSAADRRASAELLAKKPELKGKTLYDVLYRNGNVDKFPSSQMEAGFALHMTKPADMPRLRDVIETYLSNGNGNGKGDDA